MGDVSFTYESSWLVGTADRPPRSGWAVVVFWASAFFGIAALGALALGLMALVWWLMPGAALGLGLTALLEARERRRRVFVIDFDQQTLRMDFTTARLSQPRTVVVSFEDVKAVEVLQQADGASVLTVDVELANASRREVLVANIPAGQGEQLVVVRRMLINAIGLSAVVVEEKEDGPIDSFG